LRTRNQRHAQMKENEVTVLLTYLSLKVSWRTILKLWTLEQWEETPWMCTWTCLPQRVYKSHLMIKPKLQLRLIIDVSILERRKPKDLEVRLLNFTLNARILRPIDCSQLNIAICEDHTEIPRQNTATKSIWIPK
jgi:hypothetical protein